MRCLQLSSSDKRFIRRRLGRTAQLACALVLANVLARSEAISRGPVGERALQEQFVDDAPDPPAKKTQAMTGEASSLIRSVPPSGWRKTNRGWEHVDSWYKPERRSIEMLLQEEEARESAAVREMLERIQSVSPITFALMQILAVAMISRVANKRTVSDDATRQNRSSASREIVATAD